MVQKGMSNLANKIGLVNYLGDSQDNYGKTTVHQDKTKSVDKRIVKPEVFLSEQDPYFKGNPKNKNGDEINSVDDMYPTTEEKLRKSLKPAPKKVN